MIDIKKDSKAYSYLKWANKFVASSDDATYEVLCYLHSDGNTLFAADGFKACALVLDELGIDIPTGFYTFIDNKDFAILKPEAITLKYPNVEQLKPQLTKVAQSENYMVVGDTTKTYVSVRVSNWVKSKDRGACIDMAIYRILKILPAALSIEYLTTVLNVPEAVECCTPKEYSTPLLFRNPVAWALLMPIKVKES